MMNILDYLAKIFNNGVFICFDRSGYYITNYVIFFLSVIHVPSAQEDVNY